MNKSIRSLISLLIISAVFIFIGIIFGGLSKQTNFPIFEYWHQILVGVGGALFLFGNWYAKKPRLTDAFLNRVFIFTTGLLGIQIFLGQAIFRVSEEIILVGFHYIFSVLILGSILVIILYLLGSDIRNKIKPNYSSKYSKFTVLSVLLSFFALFSGLYISNLHIRDACIEWPFCSSGVLPQGIDGWIVFTHRLIVGLVGIFLVLYNRQSWKKQRSQKAILTVSNLFVVLFFAQGYVGALKTIQNFPVYMLVLHEATAVFLIGVGFVLITFVGLKGRTEEEEITEANIQFDHKQRMKDILALNKPVVVLLLLSTTIAGMVIGAGKFPEIDILIVTTVGGFLAAGGSGAINQYIDRDLDGIMTRTANRPIPSGRLTPAEGLAFGVSALVVSFYLLAGLVNILAAFLALLGMIYYVGIYSIWLKHRTVQNIVIGGGAGAIPPLVGWAAATGSLNLAAGFLFLFIFLWTPPHFWALALTRKNEYAAASVPMMPVEKGEETTKRMIFQYTLILVFSTILMWVLGFAGDLYLVGALILGGYLTYLAWQVLKIGRNRVYYRMYRHSNYYLLFLFIILAIDSTIR